MIARHSVPVAAVPAAAVFPVSAWAECTSGGCYDGLLWLLAATLAALLILVAPVIMLIVRLVQHKRRAARILGAVTAGYPVSLGVVLTF